MVEINVVFPEQKDAYIANAKVCELFQDMKAFVDGDIIVTPIIPEYIGDRKAWVFHIRFIDEGVNRTINISGGELLLTNRSNKVWAFSFSELSTHDD